MMLSLMHSHRSVSSQNTGHSGIKHMVSFGLSHEDLQDRDLWGLRMKGELNPGLFGKWQLKQCTSARVRVCVYV